MNRRQLLFSILSLLAVIFAVLPAFQYQNASGLPFQVERTHARELTVIALPGIPLPASLEQGDVIDWQAMTPEARMAVNTAISFQRLAMGNSYTLVIRRGETRLEVPVTSMPLTQAAGMLSSLIYTMIQNLLLLMLCLLALWRGRNWGAWGLSLYALMWMVGSSNGTLNVSLSTDFFTLVASDFIIYPLSLIGLYLSAESLAGPFLSKRLRLSFRTILAILIGGLEVLSFARNFGSIFLGLQVAQWFGAMMACAIASILLVLATLVSGYRHAPSDSRLRLRWIIAATVLLLAVMVLQYLTPLALNLTGGVIINVLTAICFTCYVYGVLRYRLVDLSIVIDRTLVYGATTTLVIGVLSAVNALAQHAALGQNTSIIIEVVVPLALGIVLGTVRKYVDAWVDRLFFRRKYKADKALRAFAERCAFIEQEAAILDRTIQELKRHTGTPGVALYERTPQGYHSLRQRPAGTYPESVESDDPILVTLRAGLHEAELSESGSALGQDGYAFPMTIRGVLIGVVVIASRPAEQYTGEELELLAHVVHEVGIALFAARARSQAEFLRESVNDGALPESWRARARQLVFVS
jgi:GAF domain